MTGPSCVRRGTGPSWDLNIFTGSRTVTAARSGGADDHADAGPAVGVGRAGARGRAVVSRRGKGSSPATDGRPSPARAERGGRRPLSCSAPPSRREPAVLIDDQGVHPRRRGWCGSRAAGRARSIRANLFSLSPSSNPTVERRRDLVRPSMFSDATGHVFVTRWKLSARHQGSMRHRPYSRGPRKSSLVSPNVLKLECVHRGFEGGAQSWLKSQRGPRLPSERVA